MDQQQYILEISARRHLPATVNPASWIRNAAAGDDVREQLAAGHNRSSASDHDGDEVLNGG